VRWLLGGFLAVALVAAATVGAVKVFDLDEDDGPAASSTTTSLSAASTSTTNNVPVGQAEISGTVTAFTAHDVVLASLAALPMPITVTTPERGFGAGAEIDGAEVDGEPSTIVWDAGRPLNLAGDGGSLVLAQVGLAMNPDGSFNVLLDGPAMGFAPGDYSIDTPVAVGSGIGTPRDSVDFTATDDTTIVFAGNASTVIGPQPISLTGPGSLDITGSFTVTTADGTSTVTHIVFDTGPLTIDLVPVAGGYTITGVLQGALQTG